MVLNEGTWTLVKSFISLLEIMLNPQNVFAAVFYSFNEKIG